MDIRKEPFDENTERYERWFERNKAVYLSELKAVDKLLPKEGEGIEIGVGSGRFSEPFSVEYGLDPSREMLKIAKKRGIRGIQGVGERLPFRGDRFDFVLIVTTICFFEEPQTALEEAQRILKSGGEIIIGFIDKKSPVGQEYRRKKEQNLFYREAEFYSVKEVEKMLKKAGFSDFRCSQTIFHRLDSVKGVEEPEEGSGEGSFVVIKGEK
ncbi:MAG: class I SAM-dependent methyltransferase [Candidatus Natronoplasma sp.]